jgi:hypothetical protein
MDASRFRTTRFRVRFATGVICVVAVVTIVMFVFGIGSAFTRGTFAVALVSACALIYRHDRVPARKRDATP